MFLFFPISRVGSDVKLLVDCPGSPNESCSSGISTVLVVFGAFAFVDVIHRATTLRVREIFGVGFSFGTDPTAPSPYVMIW